MVVRDWARRNPGKVSLLISAALMALLLGILTVTSGGVDTPPSPSDTASPVATPSTTGQTPAPGVPQTSQSVSATPLSTPAATPDPHGEHARPDMRPIQKTTVSYLSTFLDAKIPEAVWRAHLNALSTASHRETLATVPRAAVPTVGLRSVTVTRLASSAAAAAGVLTDGTILVVALVFDGDDWKVSRVVPQAAGQ